jgi:ABC-2 type transport system permease protein
MTALRAMLRKEWRQLVRDPAGLAMLFVMPIAFIVGLSVALQGAFASPDEAERLVVCVTGDDAVQVRALVEGIGASGMFRVRGPGSGGPAGRAQAERGVADGACAVAVVVPATMSAGIRLETAASVELLADPVLSESIVAGVESLVFQAAARGTVGYLLPRSGLAGSAAEARRLMETNGPRVAVRTAARRTDELRPNAVQQNVPAWTIFALFWLAQLLALNVLTERTSGAHVRIIGAPVSRAVYLLGKFLPFLALNLIQAAVMFAVGVVVLPWLGCPRLVLGDVVALLALTAAVSPVVVSFGLLMASVSRSHFTVGALTATLLVLMAITGGIMVPKYLLPRAMQTMSLFLPHGWALDGYQLVLVRGAGLVDVLPQVGMLLAFAAAFFLLAWNRMPWRPR